MTDSAWRPLRRSTETGTRGPALVASPFVRLARVHAVSAASDAAVAVALAGSIFFSISPDDARWRVALYLLLTMAPFAVVTPLIGPAIDRISGGRQAMILVTAIGRLVVAFLMVRHVETLWLFPEAFTLLVLQKGYAVAKTAVVPQYVGEESELVDANSRLALVSAVVGLLGAAVGGAFSLIAGPPGAAVAAMLGYLVAVVLCFQLPKVKIAPAPPAALERAELRSSAILLSASAMAILRAAVGFVTFLLAFELRGGEESLDVGDPGAALAGATATIRGVDIAGDPPAPVWHFGLVVLAAGSGALLGARLAPRLRSRFSEASILLGTLAGVVTAAVFAALFGGLSGAIVLSLGVATGAAAAKLAFDALVQRLAPDANYGRTFSRFEARFQVAWVVGAFVPAVVPLGITIGSLMVAAAVGFALVSNLLGRTGRSAVPRVVRERLPFKFASTAELDHPDVAVHGGFDRGGFDHDGDDDDVTSLDVLASQPAPPAGTADLAAREVDDDDDSTVSMDATSPERDGRLRIPPPPWWVAPVEPMVSSVDGVVVDEAVVDDADDSLDPPQA